MAIETFTEWCDKVYEQEFYHCRKPNDRHFAIMSFLAYKGDMETLTLFYEKYKVKWNSFVATSAVRGRQFEILRWLFTNGCPVNADTFYEIAKFGDINEASWAFAVGCPWDSRVFDQFALKGTIEHLEWLKTRNCPWSRWTIAITCYEDKNLETLKWLIANGCEFDKELCLKISSENNQPLIREFLLNI